MEIPPISSQNNFNIDIPFQEFFKNQEDAIQYQILVKSISQIWDDGRNLKSQQRNILWNKFFLAINQYIFDMETKSNNFQRCLSAGALFFTLDSNKIYIYTKLDIIQKLFQLFPQMPSKSAISKKFGKPLELKADQITILYRFQIFLNDLVQHFQNVDFNYGWSLYEIKSEITNITVANSDLLINYNHFNEEILDIIIDDRSDFFLQKIQQLINKNEVINQKHSLTNYKLPSLLTDSPSYASLCCFFEADKCLSLLCKHIDGGLKSDEMKLTDNKGRSPIHFACAGGSVRIVNQLINAGYDINLKEINGFTPIHYSAFFGTLPVFRFLLMKGANAFFIDSQNVISPFHAACFNGNYNIIEFLDGKQDITDFIKNDFLHSSSGDNCLSLACKSGYDNIVNYIISKIRKIENELSTLYELLFSSLHVACLYGSLNCIKALIRYSSSFKESLSNDKRCLLLYEAAISNGHDVAANYLYLIGIIKVQQDISSNEKFRQQLCLNNKINQINQNDEIFIEMLSNSDKQQINCIYAHFQKILRLSNQDYYSLIDVLANFNYKKGCQKCLQNCAVSGVIPSFIKNEYNGLKGTLMAIDVKKISKIINKTVKTFESSFIRQYCFKLTFKTASEIPQLTKDNNIFNYYNLLTNLGYDFDFFFIIDPAFEINEVHLSESNLMDTEKKYKNNVKYLEQYRLNKKQLKQIMVQNKLLCKWKEFAKQFQNMYNIILDINNSKSNENINENDINFDGLNDNDVYDCSFSLLNEIRTVLFEGILNDYIDKNNLLNGILDRIYSNEDQKEVAKGIINDITTHQKKKTWRDSNTLKFSFLLKFCSSSSYYRLFKFLNEKLPPPSTVESHFRQEIIEREKILTCSKDVTVLLDQYWKDVKDKVEVFLKEYNKKYSDNKQIDDFKINVVLGCDAAAFTNFSKKKKVKQKTKSKDNSTLKHQIFNKLVNGDFETSDLQKQFDNESIDITDDKAQYFFTMLLQPFAWTLPVSVIHLTKSTNGHVSNKEALDIFMLLKMINSHPHFSVHYFAADGETALDEFHELAFQKYEDQIDLLLNGEISFKSFFEKVKELCVILPILDMFHAEKNGRNRIINNEIKIGGKGEIIKRENLITDIPDLHDSVLNDLTSIGRMKDTYPIELFQLKNSIIEFNNKNNSSGFYIFIYSIILEIFRNPFLDLEQRSDLSKIALVILLMLYKKSSKLPESTGFRKNINSSNKFVWFTEKNNLMKLINTVIAVTTVLDDPLTSYNLGLERLSSHPEEQFFGRYRSHFLGNYTPKNAFRYAVRTTIALDFENDLGISFSIPKRENYAGAHLNFNNEKDESSPNDDFNIHENIYEIAHDLFYTGIGEKKELNDLSQKILLFLSDFFEDMQSFKYNSISMTKGSAIYPRIYANQEDQEDL